MADESRTPKYTVESELFFMKDDEITKGKVESIIITYGLSGKASVVYHFPPKGGVIEEMVATTPEELCTKLLDTWKLSQDRTF